MNDIDKMPVKCRDCPYWELASYPWCCGDCADEMNPKNSEYIKRIDAKRALTALPADLDAETVQRCIEAMNNPKATDVEPKRKTGRWVYKHRTQVHYHKETGEDVITGEKRTVMVYTDLSGKYPHCPYCDALAADSFTDYCPHCGAQMLPEPPKEEDNA